MDLGIGSKAVHVEKKLGQKKPSEILQVTIVRETPAFYVDDVGTKWRKSDLSMSPQYMVPRFLMTPEDFAAQQV